MNLKSTDMVYKNSNCTYTKESNPKLRPIDGKSQNTDEQLKQINLDNTISDQISHSSLSSLHNSNEDSEMKIDSDQCSKNILNKRDNMTLQNIPEYIKPKKKSRNIYTLKPYRT